MASHLSEIYEDDPEEARIMAWYLTGIRHVVSGISKRQQDLRRNEALILNKPIDGSEDSSIETVDIIADRDNMLSHMEEKIDIEKALWALTSKQQQVTKMIFYLGMTEKEAANKLGISQPAVHSIKNRALKKIKERMKGYMN